MKLLWQSGSGILVGATDGGLKERIGTSSYAIYLPGEITPVIYGYSAEYQPGTDASSTRQELLGQLGLEYWMDELEQTWGRSRGILRLTLVTDSQASIDVMQNVPKVMGVGAMIKAEMDVALEIHRLQSTKTWIHRQTIKVTSHIDKDDAPDEFLWECNNFVDELATKSRDRANIRELAHRESYCFPGARVGCVINGRVENNGLYKKLQEHIAGGAMRQYLCQKYDWNWHTFAKVAWEAHEKEFIACPRNKVVTLTKLIHGWQSSQKKSFREGRTLTDTCPLCGTTDTREHFFSCKNQQLTQIRNSLWAKLCAEVSHTTVSGCKEIFLVGIGTVMGRDPPMSSDMDSWPRELREAFDSQTEIGWNHVFYGRLSTQWEKIATRSDNFSNQGRLFVWTRQIIRKFWSFGIDLWQARNMILHGPDQSISKYEKDMLESKVRAMYRDLRPQVKYRSTDIFSIPEDGMLKQPVQNQVAWLERLKFLFPDEYVKIVQDTVGKIKSDQEVEMLNLRAIGMNIV